MAGDLASTFTGALRLAGAPSGAGFGGAIALAIRLFVPVLAVAAVVAALLGNERSPAGGAAWPWLRDPASGLVPLSLATSLLLVPAELSAWIPALRAPLKAIPGALQHFLRFPLAVPLALLFARLFNRPRKVAEVWGRLPGAPADAAETEARASAALRGARIRSALLVGLVVLAPALLAATGPILHLEPLTFAAAAVADAFGEWRARSLWPDLVSAWPEHRLYAADAGLEALSGAGIPAFARGVHYRTLGQFFAPYVPRWRFSSPPAGRPRRRASCGACSPARAPRRTGP